MNAGTLKAQGLCKAYKDKEVLHNLDLTIEPGKIYGLIGRNGAGKTTLLGILTAQNTKNSGEVTYDGQPVWENQKALSDICFSRELQPTLFSGPNNLKVKHYLKSAAIYYPNWDLNYALRLMDEFKLESKKKISQLSKGQMSMVTILIALASRAPITILDEPAAGMNERETAELTDFIREVQRMGYTILLIEHDVQLVMQLCDHIYVLDHGNLIAHGAAEEVRDNPAVIEAYLGGGD